MSNDRALRLRSALVLAGVVGCQALAACTPTAGLLQPSWQPEPWDGPAVQVLVNHVTCRLIKDYEAHDNDEESNWRRLAKYHFVAAVGLNLSVSNSEGLNPSFSFVTPLTALGTKIAPIITTPGTGATSASFNRTLAVGGQLTGSQTNSVTLTYQLDMQRIAMAALADEQPRIEAESDRNSVVRTFISPRREIPPWRLV